MVRATSIVSGISATRNGTASSNVGNGYGALLDNSYNTVTKPGISVIGASSFNGNRLTGLTIYSNGLVTVTDITANADGQTGGGYGVYIENDYTGNIDPEFFARDASGSTRSS